MCFYVRNINGFDLSTQFSFNSSSFTGMAQKCAIDKSIQIEVEWNDNIHTHTHAREIIEFWDAFKSASDRIYSSYSWALIAHRSCSQIIAWCSYHIDTDEENAMVAKFIRWLVTRFPLDRKFNWIFPKLILESTKLVARRCFESIS